MDAYLIDIATQGLYLVLILSGPPICVALVVGLCVSIVQATTQIQEQTLTFVPKLVAIILVLAFLGPIGTLHMIDFTQKLFSTFYKHVG
ncbi:MAG: flagellar biosynthesis protein FliQ [Deltaproteobacteria bacterium]|nr:flagellar biosynthesis protein FliQ [Deltaproteobacteria bacterium]